MSMLMNLIGAAIFAVIIGLSATTYASTADRVEEHPPTVIDPSTQQDLDCLLAEIDGLNAPGCEVTK